MESCSLGANSGDEGPLIWSGGLECKLPRPAAPTLPALQLYPRRIIPVCPGEFANEGNKDFFKFVFFNM